MAAMAMFLCLVLVGNLFPTAAFSCDSAEEEALIQKLPGLEIQHQRHQSLLSLEDAGTLRSFHGDKQVRVLERWLNVKERQDIRDSEYAKTHFVTYPNTDGPSGFNNRLESLELAFLVAVLLNRTLVVHNFSAFHRHRGGEVAPEKYLHMQAFQWPVKQWSDVDFAPPQKNYTPFTRENLHCGLDIVQLCEDLRTNYSEIPVIIAHELVGPYPYWTNIFAKQYHEVIRRFLTEYVRFNPSLCDFTQNSLQSQSWLRQPYAAMHFRLGDRPGLQMANCSLFGFRFQGHLEDIKWGHMSKAEIEAIRYGCNKPSAKDPKNHVIPLFTEDVVRSWHLPKDIKVVYIATNRPNDPRVKTVQGMFRERGLTTLIWEDLNHTLAPTRDGTEISIQEQCIAIRSKFFLPSWPSSWDAEVIYRRLDGTNVTDAKIHFELLSDSVSRVWHMYGINDCWK